MRLFLDSIDSNEIKKYSSFRIIDGLTTNPSLMAKAKGDFLSTVSSICSLIEGDVSIEVVSNDFEMMKTEGKKILDIAPNIVVKLPITWDGIKACRYFVDKGYKVNMTLCFSSSQALMVAKAGATYVSPFVGRLNDIGQDGIGLIEDIRIIYDNYQYKTQILAASIRSVDHVVQVALCGADVVTVPANIMSELIKHDLTDKGLEQFNQDWSKSGMKI